MLLQAVRGSRRSHTPYKYASSTDFEKLGTKTRKDNGDVPKNVVCIRTSKLKKERFMHTRSIFIGVLILLIRVGPNARRNVLHP